MKKRLITALALGCATACTLSGCATSKQDSAKKSTMPTQPTQDNGSDDSGDGADMNADDDSEET